MAKIDATAYLFLDTNLFLEFAYQNIDWLTASNYKRVVLVLVPKVLEEMDTHKKDPTSDRRRDRARGFSSFLGKLEFSAESMIAPLPQKKNVQISVITNSPRPEDFPDLVWAIPDDQILASLLTFSNENPNLQEHIYIVSEDNLMRLKAMARKISFLWNEDIEKHRLPQEPSPQLKQLRALELKVEELNKRISAQEPNLVVELLHDDEPISQIVLGMPELLSEDDIKRLVAKERDAFEKENNPPSTGRSAVLNTSHLFGPSSYARQEYYEELQEYYETLNYYRIQQSRTIELQIKINNSIVTANDISVILSIVPDELFLSELLDEPVPPTRPRGGMFAAVPITSNVPILESTLRRAMQNSFDVEDGQVHWEVSKLLHNNTTVSPYFYVIVPYDVQTIFVEYEIHASNQNTFKKDVIEISIQNKET